ncbi:MAG: hypothetical protein ACOYNC_15620 [Bacteroidales bacterium]
MKNYITLLFFLLTLQAGYSREANSSMNNKNSPEADKKTIRDAGNKNNNFYDNGETFVLTDKVKFNRRNMRIG